MKGNGNGRGKTTRNLSNPAGAVYARRWPKDDKPRTFAAMKPEAKQRWVRRRTRITDATGRSRCEDMPLWMLERRSENDPALVGIRRALEDEYGPFDKTDAIDVLWDWADKDRVVDATPGLDALDKAIFKMYLRGHSYREIAVQAGTSKSTVCRRVQKSGTEVGKSVVVYSESAKQIATCWNEQVHVVENRHLTHCRGLKPLDKSKAAAQPCAKTVCSQTDRSVSYCPFAYPDATPKPKALSDLPERSDWQYWGRGVNA